jgi:hypothetical protein
LAFKRKRLFLPKNRSNMTLNIELPQAIETYLIQEANQKGISLDHYLATVLKRVVYKTKQRKAKNQVSEVSLLKQINLAITEAEWAEYKQLTLLRRAETITTIEYNRLIELGDKIEAANVERLKILLKLALLRQVSLDKVMIDLGIRPVQI